MPSSKECDLDDQDVKTIDTSCWLFVGRVPNSVSTSELGDYFDQVGTVEKVLIDYGMGLLPLQLKKINKDYLGILKFESKRSRDDAVEYLNGTVLNGSPLNLEKCTAENVKKALEYFPESRKGSKREQERSPRRETKLKKLKTKYNLPLFYKFCDLAWLFCMRGN